MAWLIQADERSHPVPEIRNAAGYSVLTARYTRGVQPSLQGALWGTDPGAGEELENFLERAPLARLDAQGSESLGGPFTKSEFKEAFEELARGKTPGTDGLPVEFYYTYMTKLVPKLTVIHEVVQEGGLLPDTTRETLIVSVPKPQSDILDVAAYRPLFMLNMDYKILSKVLTNRLQPHLTVLIHSDQNGLIPQHNTSSNIRRLFRVLDETPVRNHPNALVLSIDLRKVFNTLQWRYLRAVTWCMNLGPGWDKWVALLYSDARTRVRSQWCISKAFEVHRGKLPTLSNAF
mgnify:CR=1 FL=1